MSSRKPMVLDQDNQVSELPVGDWILDHISNPASASASDVHTTLVALLTEMQAKGFMETAPEEEITAPVFVDSWMRRAEGSGDGPPATPFDSTGCDALYVAVFIDTGNTPTIASNLSGSTVIDALDGTPMDYTDGSFPSRTRCFIVTGFTGGAGHTITVSGAPYGAVCIIGLDTSGVPLHIDQELRSASPGATGVVASGDITPTKSPSLGISVFGSINYSADPETPSYSVPSPWTLRASQPVGQDYNGGTATRDIADTSPTGVSWTHIPDYRIGRVLIQNLYCQ